MNKITLKVELVQATSIKQFVNKAGRRRDRMPYYRYATDSETGDFSYVFDFVGDHTDSNALNQQIQNGLIFIREIDAKGK